MKFDIDNEEIVHLTNKLETLHKSGLPVAVRQTLNGAAFGVKGSKRTESTLQETTDEVFTKRSKNFFKITSGVSMAQGFDIGKMESRVGFSDKKLKGTSNFAVENLEEQEFGGTIGGRSFVPLKGARKGGSWSNMVRRKYRLSNINSVVDSQNISGANDAERFTKAAIKVGKGGYVLGNKVDVKGQRYLFHISSLKRRGGDTTINSKAVYSYKEDRQFDVDQTKFMRNAARRSAEHMNDIFKREAKKQIERLTK